MGNIPELGNWTEPKIFMRKTKDNIWVMENSLVTQQYYFCCKFCVINKYDAQDRIWERGVDRIIDMELLPSLPMGNYNRNDSTENVKGCELNLEWEVFYVSFSCSYPIDDPNDQLILTGSKPEIQNILMKKSEFSKNWMHAKYGDVTAPWECTIKFPNIEKGIDGKFIEGSETGMFHYKFGLENKMMSQTTWEKDPRRTLQIKNASGYQGELGYKHNDFWENIDRVFIVNGFCNKADGNFMDKFNFVEIGDTNIYIGSFPHFEEDIRQIASAGVNSVMDLMTKTDHLQRAVNKA